MSTRSEPEPKAPVLAKVAFIDDNRADHGVEPICWIPRTIVLASLERKAVSGRFGYAATLDDAPNLEGLVAWLIELDHKSEEGLKVRAIGGPERLGSWLASRCSAVEYPGPLGNGET